MTRAGTVYGQGLYALAKEEQLTEEILQQMQVLEDHLMFTKSVI